MAKKVTLEIEFTTNDNGLTKGWTSGAIRNELGGLLALDDIKITKCRTKIESL